jgi:aspartate-semialdehyde dehydrogenase
MPRKFSVGVLGATGLLGQTYVHLLHRHPWFSLDYLSSSQEGFYHEAVKGKWLYDSPPPQLPLNRYETKPTPKLLFSTLSPEKAQEIEPLLAKEGYYIISHASTFRSDPYIPLVIPEINSHHLEILSLQQRQKGWKGWILSKPNCTLPSFLLPLFPLIESHSLEKIYLTTLQSRSGAGLQAITNKTPYEAVIPMIEGEERKTENEPLKILGQLTSKGIEPYRSLQISAHCTRISIPYGHFATVHAAFKEKPSVEEWKESLIHFPHLDLPSSPQRLFLQEKRPSPIDLQMEVAIDNIRTCPLGDLRFTGLSHNVVRGGSGGGLLIAELLYKEGYLDSA